MKSTEIAKTEYPSAQVVANARSLGLLAAYMANKGTLNGKQLISEQTWKSFHSDAKFMQMDDAYPTHFNKGGCCRYGMTDEQLKATKAFCRDLAVCCHDGREDWVGWMGYGGSVFQWHPEDKIGMGYVPFDLLDLDFVNKRGA